MSHFQRDITAKQRGWLVETCDSTEFIPGDVVTVPEYLKTGVVIDVNCAQIPTDFFHVLFRVLRPYVAGEIDAVEVIEGYFGRWSAPGYLDCTPWTFGKTIRDLRDSLSEDY